MAILRDQPYANSHFQVSIGGDDIHGFSEVILPDFLDPVVEYREGGDPTGASRKLPTRPRYGPLVLKRGFRGDLALYQWWRQVAESGLAARRDVRVRLLDESAQAVVAEWRLRRALPTRYWLSPLVAQGCDVLQEHLEIASEDVAIE